MEGIDWIRLHYAFPAGFPMDALDVMNERNNICKYLDIPLQHGSSNMLKLMRRGTTREEDRRTVANHPHESAGIGIRTTFIVGHPGETEKDFEEMMTFVEQSKFERAGVFQYSHEENTHSHSMKDDVPTGNEAATHWWPDGAAAEHLIQNQSREGWADTEVLIDRKEDGNFIGRTEHDSPG